MRVVAHPSLPLMAQLGVVMRHVSISEVSGLVSRTRCGILHAAPQSRDPGFLESQATGAPALQRTASQELRAALRPGHEVLQLTANFKSLIASKSCTPPPTRLVV
jgi:hypothetical protein